MLVSREVLAPSSAEAQVSFCKRAVCVQAMTSAFGGTAGGGGPWAALSPAAAPSQCSGRGTGGWGAGDDGKNVITVDTHMPLKDLEAFQLRDGYCYAKNFALISCSCLCV